MRCQRCICFLPLLAASLVLSGAGTAALAEAPRKVAEVEGVAQYRLSNGMPVLLLPDASQSKFTVNLTILTGSRQEGYGEAGMAHLLEHMLFKGTPSHPDVPQALNERGAEFNGTTWLDRTNYFETLEATGDNLEFAIRLEADRMMNSFIKGEDLASEFSVVRSEFERGENNPQYVLMQRMQSAAYEWHNYGRTTIGNRSDIERVPITSLRAFYRKHYQVDNAVLVVTGKFETPEALELAEKHFGSIAPPKRTKDKTYTIEPAQDGERQVVLRRVGDVALVAVCYHIPASSHEDFAAAEVLSNILGTEPSGRLYKGLVETQLASNVVTMNFTTHDPGLLFAAAELPPGADIDQAQQKLIAIVEGIAVEGVTAEEVDRSRQELSKQFELESASSSKMALSLSEWAARGDWRLRFLHRDRVQSVTAEQVDKVAAKYLVRNNRTSGKFIPTDEPQRATVPDAPDLASLLAGYSGQEQVAAGEVFDSSLENIERRTTRAQLPEGIKVAVLPKKTRGELVTLRLSLRYGNEDALKGLNAAAEALPVLMARGTKQLTYEQLQDELTRCRAELNTSGFAGLATFELQTKREHLESALELLRQIVREPRMAQDEFEVVQRRNVTDIQSGMSEPYVRAARRLQRLLQTLPADHVRYVPSLDEELQRWKSVTLADVKRLHEEFLGAQAGELVVVGDFGPDEIKPIVRRMLDDWQADVEFRRIADPAPEGVAGRTESIITPDKANAVYAAALQLPMTDEHEDYPALVIGNYVIGGGPLTSRLADRVRQQEGLSYGVGSMFTAHPIDKRGQFGIRAIANPKNRDKLVGVIAEELDRVLKDGITPEELQRAKDGYLKTRQVHRSSNDQALVGMLANSSFTGRTMQFEIDFENRVRALTVEEVNAALRKHIQPSRLVIVTAGDFSSE